MTVTSETKAPAAAGNASARKTAETAAEQIARRIRDWLPGHCRRLPGVSRAIALTGNADTHNYQLAAGYPDGFKGTRPMVVLAESAFAGRSEAKRLKDKNGPFDIVSMPILDQGKFLGALVVEARGLDDARRKALYALIRGKAPATTTPEEARHQRLEEAKHHRLAIVLDLLAACLDADRAQSTAMGLVTELATRSGCDRVSYGRVNRHGQVRVTAVSNSARLARRSNLIRAIESAMEEAIDYGNTVIFPRNEETLFPDREHAALSRMQGGSHVLSVPLPHEGIIVGALTLERHGTTQFDDGIVKLCESLSVIAGPILELKHRDNQLLLGKAADSARRFFAAVTGPRHVGLKMAVAMLTVLFAWLTLSTGTHRVTAPAQLEGRVHRAVIAPLDGFVASSNARAGDEVREGQLLSRLDDKDLKLEVAKWKSEAAQLRKQYRGALASHDRAETSILSAKVDRATAQLDLLQAQLARTELRAPFDGVVVAGDLSQLLGSPVQRGDVLFEIAPLNDYRVVLEVDERDLGELQSGQSGRLALEGLPGDSLTVVVDQITPVATARDGRNFFRVEGRVDSETMTLRPGMAGVAKISVGERKRLWIWTHRMTDWLKMRLWTWMP